MIVRVWGIVNGHNVEFTPVADRPNYYEGYAPASDDLQEIEIWAENSQGAIGTIKRQIRLEYHTTTTARLIISPYFVTLLPC